MKSTRKILSLLLVVAMLFTLAVPVFAEETQTQTATKATAIAAGDQIVIYNADSGKVMTSESYTYSKGSTTKDELKSVAATVAEGKMTVPTGAVVLTVAVNKDGQYSFVTADGKYLYADGTHVRLVADQGDNTLFVLETATDGFFVKCATATYNEKAQYLEFFNSYFTVFGMNTSKAAIYTFQFFKLDKAGEMDGKTVILHTNDVHGAIAGYAYVAALKADFEAKGADVILVDAGDYSQGTTYVSDTKGADAIDLMNLVGYDYATIGNHEFDYGYAQLAANLENADFTVLCSDVFKEDGSPIFGTANAIEEINGLKVGFFGLETPEAQTKANPALIKGLTFLAKDELFANAQAQVNELKEAGADVVICLGHLGDDAESAGNRSTDLMQAVTGIDMFIDGHSTVFSPQPQRAPSSPPAPQSITSVLS